MIRPGRIVLATVAIVVFLLIVFPLLSLSPGISVASNSYFSRLLRNQDEFYTLWVKSPLSHLFNETSLISGKFKNTAVTALFPINLKSSIENEKPGQDGQLQESKLSASIKEQRHRQIGYLYGIQGAKLHPDYSGKYKGRVEQSTLKYTDEDFAIRRQKLWEDSEKARNNREQREKENQEKEEAEKKKAEEEKQKAEEEKKKAEEKQKLKEKLEQEEKEKQKEANTEGNQDDTTYLNNEFEKRVRALRDTDFGTSPAEPIYVVSYKNVKGPVAEAIFGRNPEHQRIIEEAAEASREKYCKERGYTCITIDLNKISKEAEEELLLWPMAYTMGQVLNKKSDNVKGIEGNSLVPEGKWTWFLESHVLITNTQLSPADALLNPKSRKERLTYGSRFQYGKGEYEPLIRFPNSLTDAELEALDMYIARRPEGFSTNSLFVRNNEWSRFWGDGFMDVVVKDFSAASDATAQGDVLQYIYLKHETFRSKVGVVPLRLLNSLDSFQDKNLPLFKKYEAGDIASTMTCYKLTVDQCKKHVSDFIKIWIWIILT